MDTITPELLLQAYAVGLFPMAEAREDATLYWVEPKVRGILPLDRLHVSRRLRRTLRTSAFAVRIDTAFGAVTDGMETLDKIAKVPVGPRDTGEREPERSLPREDVRIKSIRLAPRYEPAPEK